VPGEPVVRLQGWSVSPGERLQASGPGGVVLGPDTGVARASWWLAARGRGAGRVAFAAVDYNRGEHRVIWSDVSSALP
jgi:hypothetical protein